MRFVNLSACRWLLGAALLLSPACGETERGGAEEPRVLQALAPDEIAALYAAWGGASGALGAQTDTGLTPDGRGTFAIYEQGAIYHTPETGAHVVFGALFQKWAEGGWETGLGYPVADSALTADQTGWFSLFERGSLYWSPNTGAHDVRGFIYWKWAAYGWEKSALGYPVSDEFEGEGGFRASTFENGQIQWRQLGDPLKVFTQNMAFLVAPGSYGGADCNSFSAGDCNALNALIGFLKRERPDIVGLQEMFDQSAVDYLLADGEIAALYPHRMFGPDENDLESDGGAGLLSRFPIGASDSTIYRKCSAVDCAANKGVLYAKVMVTPEVPYDVFVTHTQNPNASGGGADRDTVNQQLETLGHFVAAKRGLRQWPAIVMGDLNIDARDPNQYRDLMSRLGNPIDIWTAAHPNEPGITSDSARQFNTSNQGRPRGVDGSRIDYILVYQGDRFQAALLDTKVIMETTANGWDMSDHYGLLGAFDRTHENDVIYWGPISSVTAELAQAWCFEVTDGTLGAYTPGEEPDEVQWFLSMRVDAKEAIQRSSGLVEGINEHEGFRPNVSAITDGPVANGVIVQSEGMEVDPFLFGETGRASLGVMHIELSKEQLFEALHTPQEFGMGQMRGDGGEYMSTVVIRAAR